jgi:2-phosphosulfolactate phosphatase
MITGGETIVTWLRARDLQIDVYQTPGEIGEGDLAGVAVVVTDVLRASTTMTAALAAGAAGIAVFATVEEARSACSSRLLTGGERNGVRVEGFDLGNSPLEYNSDRVAGKEIRFTTSNGTGAIKRAEGAEVLVVGSFVNARAVEEFLSRRDLPIAIVCAGTEGRPTLEDTLFAGKICDALCRPEYSDRWQPGLAARAAAEIWRTAVRQIEGGASLYDVLCHSPWARRLLDLGRSADIEFAGEMDKYAIVPYLDRTRGLIVIHPDTVAK